MMMSCLTIFTVIFAVFSSLIVADDPCRFQHERGVIDITSLGRSDGIAQYPNRIPPTGSNYRYSYNPCRPFSEGPNCMNVAVCQSSSDGLFSFTLGIQESAMWSAGDGLGSNPSVSYTFGEKRVNVRLECTNDGREEFEALGEDPINTYKFRLLHKCACWNGCGGGPPPTHPPTQPIRTTTSSGGGSGGGSGTSIGGGAVFIIIFLVLIFVYFVGFALYYRFRLERSGLELIPHRTFWGSLPGYAKDGAVHVYQRVANKGAAPYQPV